MTDELLRRIEQLEARLTPMADREEITRLITMHPLGVDTGEADLWMANWTDDSLTDKPEDPSNHSGDFSGIYGKVAMIAEIKSPELAASRASGLMHLSTNPVIALDGDEAVATNYTQLIHIRMEPLGYEILFVVVNRWELVRLDGRWSIRKRTLRALGQPEAVELLRSGIDRPWATRP